MPNVRVQQKLTQVWTNRCHDSQAISLNLTKCFVVKFIPAVFRGENETELHFVTIRFPGFQIVSAHLQVPQAGNRLLTHP